LGFRHIQPIIEEKGTNMNTCATNNHKPENLYARSKRKGVRNRHDITICEMINGV